MAKKAAEKDSKKSKKDDKKLVKAKEEKKTDKIGRASCRERVLRLV